jgi:hypothetical protein
MVQHRSAKFQGHQDSHERGDGVPVQDSSRARKLLKHGPQFEHQRNFPAGSREALENIDLVAERIPEKIDHMRVYW